MTGFLLRLGISALGLWLASEVVPGIRIETSATLVLAALLLGVVNAIVRPFVILLTLPITVVTLGIFLLIINGLMLMLVSSFLQGFLVAGLGSAVLGSIIVSITSWFASSMIGSSGRFEVIVVDRRG